MLDWASKADEAFKDREFKIAILFLDKAIEEEPKSEYYAKKGEILSILKNFNEAFKYCNLALKMEENVNNYIVKADVLLRRKDYSLAIECLDEGLKIASKEEKSNINNRKGDIYLATKNYRDAVKCYENALKQTKNKNKKAHYSDKKGNVYLKLGEYNEAIKSYTKAIAFSEHSGYWAKKANVLHKLGCNRQAIEC